MGFVSLTGLAIELPQGEHTEHLKEIFTCFEATSPDKDQLSYVAAQPKSSFKLHIPYRDDPFIYPLWCRIELSFQSAQPESYTFLVLATLKELNLYYGANAKALKPATPRLDFFKPTMTFDFLAKPGDSLLMFRAAPASPYFFQIDPLVIRTEHQVYEQELYFMALLFALGVMFTLFSYYLITGIALKSPHYFIYSMTCLSLGLLFLIYGGFINLEFDPLRGFHRPIPALATGLFYGAAIFYAIFSMMFLEVATRFPKLWPYIKNFILFLVLYHLVHLALQGIWRGIGGQSYHMLGYLLVTLPIMGLLGTIIYRGLKERHSLTYIFVIGWLPYLLVYPLYVGWPYYTGTMELLPAMGAILFSLSFEALVFAMGLSLKLNADRRKAEKMDSLNVAAKTVQNALLPSPDLQSYQSVSIESYYEAAEHAGGDWFRYHLDEDRGHFFLQICDVTGHGIPSAIITGVISGASLSCFYEFDDKDQAHPEEALLGFARKVNHVLQETGASVDCYATMTIVYVNLFTGEGTVVGCGHPPVYLFGNGKLTTLPGRGAIMGMSKEGDFGVCKFQMEPGDSLFTYTDGLMENTSKTGHTFRYRDLKKILKSGPSALAAKTSILEQASTIWDGNPPEDDVTFVVARLHRYLSSPLKKPG